MLSLSPESEVWGKVMFAHQSRGVVWWKGNVWWKEGCGVKGGMVWKGGCGRHTLVPEANTTPSLLDASYWNILFIFRVYCIQQIFPVISSFIFSPCWFIYFGFSPGRYVFIIFGIYSTLAGHRCIIMTHSHRPYPTSRPTPILNGLNGAVCKFSHSPISALTMYWIGVCVGRCECAIMTSRCKAHVPGNDGRCRCDHFLLGRRPPRAWHIGDAAPPRRILAHGTLVRLDALHSSQINLHTITRSLETPKAVLRRLQWMWMVWSGMGL